MSAQLQHNYHASSLSAEVSAGWRRQGAPPGAVGVILIDRNNHHVFMPLLYQVATAASRAGRANRLSDPRDSSAGKRIRRWSSGEVNRRQQGGAYVIGSSADRRDVPIRYDYLILATGVSHSYFGHDEFAPFAPGLKTLADAVAVRNRVLQAFEQAEARKIQPAP